jgi:hypothetical protein
MNDVTLSAAARDWVLAHGGTVTLRAAPQHGCCGGHAAVPVAEVRVPNTPADFQHVIIDRVEIYRAPELAEGPYRIGLEGFWRWRRLIVEGVVSPWRPR